MELFRAKSALILVELGKSETGLGIRALRERTKGSYKTLEARVREFERKGIIERSKRGHKPSPIKITRKGEHMLEHLRALERL